jgi:hypothetical protein
MEILYREVLGKYNTNFFHDTCKVEYKTESNDDDFIEQVIRYRSPNERRWELKESIDNEEILINNYNNIFASILSNRTIVVVEKNNEKISLKIFWNQFQREAGKKYFRKSTSVQFVTYRYKDGAVFYGVMNNYHKKRKFSKSVRRYTFGSKDIINDTLYLLNRVNSDYKNKPINVDVKDAVWSFIYGITGEPNKESFYQNFLNKQGVKYPNNFKSFYSLPVQNILKKEYAKHDFKFIDTLMWKLGLTGKKIRRVLHKVESFDMNTYNRVIKLYGDQYINSQDDNILKLLFENNISIINQNMDLSLKEKHNSFEIFKLVLFGSIDPSVFSDHIRFYNLISRFEPIKWRTNNYEEFLDEHQEWSEKYNSYTNGDFERSYCEMFVNEIQGIILGEDFGYLPKVLKTSKEYNEESGVQSNCVRTYIKRPESLIISLRRTNGERATIEYRIYGDKDKRLKIKRVQTLGKFNHRLDETWNRAVSRLDERVYGCFTDDFIESYSITSVGSFTKIHSKVMLLDDWPSDYEDLPFLHNERYRLKWENSAINQINGGYQINQINNFADELGF